MYTYCQTKLSLSESFALDLAAFHRTPKQPILGFGRPILPFSLPGKGPFWVFKTAFSPGPYLSPIMQLFLRLVIIV